MLDRTRLIHRDDAPVSEEPPKEDTPFLYTSSFCLREAYHERLLWHAWLPFAVNVEWGTIYYAYVPMCYLHMQPRIYFCPQHFRLDKDIYAFSRKRVVELFTGNAYELSDARDSSTRMVFDMIGRCLTTSYQSFRSIPNISRGMSAFGQLAENTTSLVMSVSVTHS